MKILNLKSIAIYGVGLSLILFIAIANGTTGTTASGREGGGGDPVAAEFSDLLTKISLYVRSNPGTLPEVDPQLLIQAAQRLHKSLNDNSQKSLVEVVETRPTDAHGVQKAAVYNLSKGMVIVHRPTWQTSAPEEKVIAAGMEGLGLSGVTKNRYARAFQVLGKNYQYILNTDIRALVDVELPIPNQPSLTGHGEVLVKGTNAFQIVYLHSCETPSTPTPSCIRVKTDIQGKVIFNTRADQTVLLRPGYYRLTIHSNIGRQHSLRNVPLTHQFYLQNGARVSLPIARVTVMPWSGPGAIKVAVTTDLSQPDIRKTYEDIATEGLSFPMSLKNGTTARPESFNEPNVQIKNICEVFTMPDSNAIAEQREACRRILARNIITRADYLQLKMTILSASSFQTMTYDECYGECGNTQIRFGVFEPSEIKEMQTFLRTHSQLRILAFDTGIPWFKVGVPKSLSELPYFLENLKPESSFFLLPGRYIGRFTNESGHVVEVPFEIDGSQSEYTLQF